MSATDVELPGVLPLIVERHHISSCQAPRRTRCGTRPPRGRPSRARPGRPPCHGPGRVPRRRRPRTSVTRRPVIELRRDHPASDPSPCRPGSSRTDVSRSLPAKLTGSLPQPASVRQ
ncbi:hypothetical protein [Streptomyces mayteni]